MNALFDWTELAFHRKIPSSTALGDPSQACKLAEPRVPRMTRALLGQLFGKYGRKCVLCPFID